MSATFQRRREEERLILHRRREGKRTSIEGGKNIRGCWFGEEVEEDGEEVDEKKNALKGTAMSKL